MNATFRKLAAAVAIAVGLGTAAPVFAWYNPCAPWGYCPAPICNFYGCF
jgi:hypothetical protein